MGKNILQIPEAIDSNGQDEMHIGRNGQDFRIKTSLIAGVVNNENTSGNWAKGGVIYSGTGLVYNVWANQCRINGIIYNTYLSDTVTLSEGDASNPRFDIFTVNVNTGTSVSVLSLSKEEGTPASSPILPNLDLTTQAQISFRLTAATETSDPITTVDLIYAENVGVAGGEWNNTTNTTGGNLDNTTDPYNGTKSFSTPATSNDSVSWTDSSLKTFNASDSLVFPLKTLLNKNSGLQIKLINSSDNTYYLKTVRYGDLASFGFVTTVALWQLVQIDLSEFISVSSSNTQYDRIEYTFIDTPILGLDWIHIQGGIVNPTLIKEPLTIINTITQIDLSNYYGNYCNMGSANASTSYTHINKVLGGFSRVLINAASQPSVAGATLIKGSVFLVNTNMYMTLNDNGSRVEYWFEQIIIPV